MQFHYHDDEWHNDIITNWQISCILKKFACVFKLLVHDISGTVYYYVYLHARYESLYCKQTFPWADTVKAHPSLLRGGGGEDDQN